MNFRRLGAGVAVGLLGGCAAASGVGAFGADPLPVGRVEIESERGVRAWRVEIAETEGARGAGLSGREAVQPGTGMYFIFPEEQSGSDGFWMRGVDIPLDIAFVDAEGAVVSVQEMEPCRRLLSLFCPRYSPGEPYRAALEVPSGELTAAGVQAGARVRLLRAGDPGP